MDDDKRFGDDRVTLEKPMARKGLFAAIKANPAPFQRLAKITGFMGALTVGLALHHEAAAQDGIKTASLQRGGGDSVVGATKIGKETGLPLPRFVSLKANVVNMRVGPGRKYGVRWQYRRRGLPVEVIQEFDQWRRIRDADGSTGWVLHSLLSNRRTAVVAPWEKVQVKFGQPIRKTFFEGKKSADADAATIARPQAGLIVDIDECADRWCAVEVRNYRFYLKQEALWGVYPGEPVEG
ncbi:MAG: SH3 domain-containing protein [Pseudomonadota bacterium]